MPTLACERSDSFSVAALRVGDGHVSNRTSGPSVSDRTGLTARTHKRCTPPNSPLTTFSTLAAWTRSTGSQRVLAEGKLR